MDVIKAVAYLDYTGLLSRAEQLLGFPARWKPQEIKSAVGETQALEQFAKLWEEFKTTERINAKSSLDTFFRRWNVFLNEKNKGST